MIASAISLGPYRRIKVGPRFHKLPQDQQQAVIAHELGHLHGHHTELRILCLIFAPFLLKWLCHKTEIWADRYAVKRGHAIAMLKLLDFEHPGDFFNPSTSYRRKMITLALPTLQADSMGSA